MVDWLTISQWNKQLIRGYDLGKEGQDLSTLVFVFDESGDEVPPFGQIHESYAGRASHQALRISLVVITLFELEDGSKHRSITQLQSLIDSKIYASDSRFVMLL
jgi:hypothetical protein